MPAFPTVLAGNMLQIGLNSAFWDIYEQYKRTENPLLPEVMAVDQPSDGRYETYGAFQTAPYPELTYMGEPTPFGAFDALQWTTINYPYEIGVAWHRDDLADDKTKSLYQMAESAGEHFGTIRERWLADLLNGSATILPAIPNAADGSAMFVNTTRFGQANGNTVATTGTTAAALKTDFWSAVTRYYQFTDPKGQPFLSPENLKSFIIMIPPALQSAALEAFSNPITLAGALTSTSNGPIPNNIMTAGLEVKLWVNPYLSSSTVWFVFAKNVRKKACYQQTREALQRYDLNPTNNSNSVLMKQDGIVWRRRDGVGVALPVNAIKVA